MSDIETMKNLVLRLPKASNGKMTWVPLEAVLQILEDFQDD